MKKINVGLIGFGYIGKIHTIAYRDIALALSQPMAVPNLAALLRTRLDTEIEAMQSSGFGLFTTDPDEFYDQPLDMVDICTPNFLHLEQCQRAFQSSLAVYCEKPLANNLDEAHKLVEMAEQAHAITQVAFVMRYIPAIRQMKALIQAGEIGDDKAGHDGEEGDDHQYLKQGVFLHRPKNNKRDKNSGKRFV